MADIRALIEAQILEVWGRGRTELVDRLYAEDVIDHMPVPGQAPGREPMKAVVHDFRRALPDLHMELHGTVVAGDMGVDFWTLTGTHAGSLLGVPPTGRRVRFSGIDMVRVGPGGRIAELWHVEEMAHFWRQIGIEEGGFGAPVAAVAVPPTVDTGYDPGAGARVAVAPDAHSHRTLAIGRRHIEEMWARGRLELAHHIYAPEVIDHNPAPGQRPGIEGIIDVLTWLREAVPDLRMAVHQYVASGSLVADRWELWGTHNGAPLMGVEPRGRQFRIAGMDVSRVSEDGRGRITGVWHVEDFAQMRAQIAAR